eukprot:1328691-Rhodomonas_salina.1
MPAQLYWRRRQDGVLLMDKHTQNPSVHTAKIGGSSSSFRAEAGAMFLAVTNADPNDHFASSLTV